MKVDSQTTSVNTTTLDMSSYPGFMISLIRSWRIGNVWHDLMIHGSSSLFVADGMIWVFPSCQQGTIQIHDSSIMVSVVESAETCHWLLTISLLHDHLHPFTDSMYPIKYRWLQQDNAQYHWAQVNNIWFEDFSGDFQQWWGHHVHPTNQFLMGSGGEIYSYTRSCTLKYHVTVHDYWNSRVQHISISHLTTWFCAILNYNVLSGQKHILHCIKHFLMTFCMCYLMLQMCVCQILKIIKILSLNFFFFICCAFLLI